jgi:hypothetical protein
MSRVSGLLALLVSDALQGLQVPIVDPTPPQLHASLLAEQPEDDARQAGRLLLVDNVRHPSVHKAQAFCQVIDEIQPHLWLPSEEVFEILPSHEGEDGGL